MSSLTEQLKETTDLDEKLALIDKMLAEASNKEQDKKNNGTYLIPSDPADLTLCLGCQ